MDSRGTIEAHRAALRDASKYIAHLENQIDLLRIELAMREQPATTMRSDEVCVAAAKRACVALGIPCSRLIERSEAGTLYRDHEAIDDRADVVRWMHAEGKRRGNQYSSWDIARAVGYFSHTPVLNLIREAEAMEMARAGAVPEPAAPAHRPTLEASVTA